MPTAIPEPSLADFLLAFRDGVRATRDRYADVREGAVYDYWGGVAAILWSRNARRDTDLWRAIYFDSAESLDLTSLLADRYNFDRIPDGYGVGTAKLVRPSTAAGEGMFWRGTRLAVAGRDRVSKRYVVTSDKAVNASDLRVDLDIRAELAGPGTAIDTGETTMMRVDDPVWDPTWGIDRLTCSDGTSFEPAAAARARLRDARRAARPGFLESLIQACKDAGAETALLFPSDYAGEEHDYGLNMAYVGDAGFQGSEALCRKIAIALERTRILGDQMQVRPMTRTSLSFSARVHLWDSPARVAQADVIKRLTGAILGYFSSTTDGFSYQRDAIVGAMMKASPEVQLPEVIAPSSDAGVVSLVDGALNFPAVLPRYILAPNDITLELLPPL